MTSTLAECPIQNAESVTEPFINEWLSKTSEENIHIYEERDGIRANVMPTIIRAVADHFRSVERIEASIERLGFTETLNTFRNVIPEDQKTRSGDLGEVFCTEYIIQNTPYRVPVKKLRWKDDRDRTMRGNDVLAFRIHNRVNQILKAESKSRASLSNTVVQEAEDGLLQHEGRPNPSSLAYLQNRLEEAGHIEEADFIAALQQDDFSVQNVRHLIFTFSGNAPLSYLRTKKEPPADRSYRRHLIGFCVRDHQAFITAVYQGCIDGTFTENR
jgi:hypothetical protein